MLMVCAIFAALVLAATVFDWVLQCIASSTHKTDSMLINVEGESGTASDQSGADEKTPLVVGTD